MKKIVVKLTKKQISEMEIAKDGMGTFGLLAQPLLCAGVMKVLILNTREFNKAYKFMKKFVPKKLRDK